MRVVVLLKYVIFDNIYINIYLFFLFFLWNVCIYQHSTIIVSVDFVQKRCEWFTDNAAMVL